LIFQGIDELKDERNIVIADGIWITLPLVLNAVWIGDDHVRIPRLVGELG